MPGNPEHLLQYTHNSHSPFHHWLTESSSITEKLQKETGDGCIQVLNQGLRQTVWWEHFVLNLNKNDKIFSREILMFSQGKSCWYAHTMIPYDTYNAHALLFERLKSESLTPILYNTPGIKRTGLIHYPVNRQTIEWHWIVSKVKRLDDVLWARLSTYQLNGIKEFYLLEIFLPGLLEVLNES